MSRKWQPHTVKVTQNVGFGIWPEALTIVAPRKLKDVAIMRHGRRVERWPE